MLEQLYTDFTTKLLPKVADGLSITKDYFIDLFGRYAKFLFYKDLFLSIIFFLISLGIFFGLRKLYKWAEREDEFDNGGFSTVMVFGFFIAMGMFGASMNSVVNTIKDKYIPEIRIYEEIKKYTINQ